MAYLKCELGKPIILHIDEVTTEQGKFGPQTIFHAGDDSFAMSPESAKRQLDQIGVSDPTGLTFEFSKVDIGKGRTAINIKQVTTATSGPPKAQPFDQPVQSAPPSRQVAPQPTTADAQMLRAHEWALAHVAPLYVAKGIPLSMDALAACAHSLFINSTRH